MKLKTILLTAGVLSFMEAQAQEVHIFTFTGEDQVITIPEKATSMKVKAWGAGGAIESGLTTGMYNYDKTRAGAGGYTYAEFGEDVVVPGNKLAVMVGQGGYKFYNKVDGKIIPEGYGFSARGYQDQGGGLSGVFMGEDPITATSQSRALVVAGGGGGADHNGYNVASSANYASGTNGNGANTGGNTGTMLALGDEHCAPYVEGESRASLMNTIKAYMSGGGGGYEGGSRHSWNVYVAKPNYTPPSPYNQDCLPMFDYMGGKGGSGFVAASATAQSIEATEDGVSLPPNTTDEYYKLVSESKSLNPWYSATNNIYTNYLGKAIGKAGLVFGTLTNEQKTSEKEYDAGVSWRGGDGLVVVEFTDGTNTKCTEDATTGTGLDTKVGITLLGRAGKDDPDNWPMVRKGAWMALESNTKGMVLTRLTTAQINAIAKPEAGMLTYDTTDKCIKMYDGTEWGCLNPCVQQTIKVHTRTGIRTFVYTKEGITEVN